MIFYLFSDLDKAHYKLILQENIISFIEPLIPHHICCHEIIILLFLHIGYEVLLRVSKKQLNFVGINSIVF